MADGEVEAEDPQAGLIKGKERRYVIERMRRYSYSLPYMRTEPVCGISLKRLNEQGQKKEAAYCQIHAQISEKYFIISDDYKSKWNILRSHASYGDENMKKYYLRLLRKSIYFRAQM